MAEVAIVQRVLPHYRVPFFEQLRSHLHRRDVRLRVLVGTGSSAEAARRDAGVLPWAESYETRTTRFGGRELVWQPVVGAVRSADLVVVEQASRLLLNYLLLSWRATGGPRVAWWGHGQNLNAGTASPVAEAVKRRLASRADWWFCYTEGTSDLIQAFGVDPRRVTVVQNTTDTTALRRAREGVTDEDRDAVRQELGLGDGPVALSLGSLYPAKRYPFLVEAADRVRERLPDFSLIVVGDGPDRPALERAAGRRPWLHVLGALHDEALARVASPASLILNPGVVGLSVVDGFALGLPMLTCVLAGHGPEIEYLEDGLNGRILAEPTTPEQYALEAARLLSAGEDARELSRNATWAAERYTMAEMVHRFADGIAAALAAPRAEARVAGAVRGMRRRWTT